VLVELRNVSERLATRDDPHANDRLTAALTALTVINIGGSLYCLDFIAERSEPGLYVDRATSKERRHRQQRRKPSPFAVGVEAAQPRGPPRRHRCKSLPENMPIIDRNFERFINRSCTQVTDWLPGFPCPAQDVCTATTGVTLPQNGMRDPLRLFQPTRWGTCKSRLSGASRAPPSLEREETCTAAQNLALHADNFPLSKQSCAPSGVVPDRSSRARPSLPL
jgi:hypothetical protein